MPPQPAALPSLRPDIRLFGPVNEAMLGDFFRQQQEAPPDKALVFELSSNGGNADIGRRIAQELRLWQEEGGRQLWFLGKTCVYSAAVTIMAAIPRDRRFLTRDCEVLVHERKMTRDIHLQGALRSCRAVLQDALAEIESGQRLERAGFAELVKGTDLSVDDIEKRVLDQDWYFPAQEAHRIGLVAGLV